MFPLLEDHIIEFEKLLKKCQQLRSLYFKEACSFNERSELEYGDYLSDALIREASTNLREIEFTWGTKFSLKTLETFFEKWRGRPAVSLYMGSYFCYPRNDLSLSARTELKCLYMELINKYKIEGLIKHINV
jgi:hypothetical protein